MARNKNHYLMLGASLTVVAALAHLGCIVFGGDWYRFLGAGEQMAVLAEQGHWYPTAVTLVIVFVLSLWAIYGYSGANVIVRLPLLRTALCLISAIYLIRGIAFVVIVPFFPGNTLLFWIVSSGICFGIGCLYALGTYQQWNSLGSKEG